jgi:hypothetical protein
MELVVKLYTDKPSRIGIKFIYEFLAVKAYEDLIRKHGGNSYSAALELTRTGLNLKLTSLERGTTAEYKDLEFNTGQLQKLKQVYDKNMMLQFVHVYPKENRLFVAKPFRRESFVEIANIEWIGFER